MRSFVVTTLIALSLVAVASAAGRGTTHLSAAALAPASTAAPAATTASGPVPAGTTATSVSFISPSTGFVLGTAPCSHPPCTVIVRTEDRGQSWAGLPAPVEKVSAPSGYGLWGLRFADANRGYAFGDGMWSTVSGGASWQRVTPPAKFVMAFAAVRDRELVGVATPCLAGRGCASRLTLYHRPIGGGKWHALATSGAHAFDESIAVHGNVVWALLGERLFVSTNAGRSFRAHSQPCPRKGSVLPMPTSIADDGADTYLLCTGQGFTGHTLKYIDRTTGTRGKFSLVGRPPAVGDGGMLAAGSDHAVALATSSAVTVLDRSADGGRHWHAGTSFADGGAGWADLGFTTATDGVVIHGPAIKDKGAKGFPGQLLLTEDGGQTWHAVVF
jgi:photosystem II stability/assembly factor-like uncharacterized protein